MSGSTSTRGRGDMFITSNGGVRWRDDRVLDTIQRSISGESGGKKVFASEIVEQYGWEKNALIWISRHTLTFACHRVIDS